MRSSLRGFLLASAALFPLALAPAAWAEESGATVSIDVKVTAWKVCPGVHAPELMEDASVSVTARFPGAGSASLGVPSTTVSAETGDGGFGDASGECTVSGDFETTLTGTSGTRRPRVLHRRSGWKLDMTIDLCPAGYDPHPDPKTRTPSEVIVDDANNITLKDSAVLFCRCREKIPKTASALMAPSPEDHALALRAAETFRPEERDYSRPFPPSFYYGTVPNGGPTAPLPLGAGLAIAEEAFALQPPQPESHDEPVSKQPSHPVNPCHE